MIVNEYTSWWRKRRRTVPHAQLDDYDVPTPDHAGRHAEREAMVQRLARLPRRQRAAVVLRFYEGLPDAESPTSSAAAKARSAATCRAGSQPCASTWPGSYDPRRITAAQGADV